MKHIKKTGLIILGLIIYLGLYGQTSELNHQTTTAKNDSNTVNVAFGSISRENSVGSLYVVDPKEILEYDNIQDVRVALFGRVPGFFDGTNLRGLGGALFIVDGLPRDVSSINMLEIDQITVLKDINSSVLYGNDAVNGIVLVKTKRGRIQKNQIKITGHYGLSTPAELPRFLSSADYAKLYNEARVNDGLTPPFYQSDIDGYESGKNVIKYPNVDYYSDEYIKQIRPYSNVNTEFIGGNNIATYYATLGWDRMGTYLNFGEGKNNQSNTFNFRANVDLNVNSFITTAVDVAAIFQNASAPRTNYWAQASTLRPNLFQPLIPVELIERNNVYLNNAKNLIDGKYLLGGTKQYLTNPIADMYSAGKNEGISNHFAFNNRINVNLDKLTEGLAFHTNLSFDYLIYYNQYINNSYSVYRPVVIGDSIRITEQYNLDSRTGEQYVSGQGFQRRVGYYGMLDYNRTFDKTHHVYGSILAMGNHQKNNNTVQEIKNANIGIRLAYVYDKRYGIDFSGALQNSVKLPPKMRNAFSPSLGLAWTVSNEDFMLEIKEVVNHLKLRVSGGLLNTDGKIDSYSYYFSPYQSIGTFWWFDSNSSNVAIGSVQGGNPNLGYEKRKELNTGLETGLFNNTIVLNADFYLSSFYDRITQPTTIFPSYYTDFIPYYNFNAYKYQGVDFGIVFNKQLGDFTINAGLNALYQYNEVTKRSEAYPESYLSRIGRPIDALFGLEADGFFNDKNDIDNHFFQTYGNVVPGDIKYIDQNNDLIINDNDMIYLGRRWPPFTYGINLRLQYKNLTLFAIGNGQHGAKEFVSGDYYWIDGNKKYSEVVLNRWTEATKETATYPRLSSLKNNNNYRASTFWLYDNDSFLLQRVQCTYHFPSKLTAPMHIKELNIFVNATNLLTISKYRKMKELIVNSAPFSRYFSIGLNINFN